MKDLNKLSGYELVALASIIAIKIAEEFPPEEVDVLGNFFSALGSNLSTIGSANST